MSLINETLRELDARRSAGAGSARGATAASTPSLDEPEPESRRWMAIAAGAVAAIAAVVAWSVDQTLETGAASDVAPAAVTAGRAIPTPMPDAEPRGRGATAVPRATAAPASVPTPASAPAPALPTAPISENAASAAPTARQQTVAVMAAADATFVADRPATGTAPGSALKLDTRVIAPAENRAPAIVRETRKASPEDEADDRYRRAVALVNKGRDDQARALLTEALRLAPHHLAARQMLATLLDEAESVAGAERILREGRALHPDHAWFALSLSRLLAARGELEEAAATLRSGLGGRDVTPGYHAAYAAILLRLGRATEAARQYEQALASQPAKGEWWMGLGLALAEQGRTEDARAAYRRALATHQLGDQLEAFVRAKLSE